MPAAALTRAQLPQAVTLVNMLNDVNAAIAAVAAGGTVVGVVISDPSVTPAVSRMVSGLSIAGSTVSAALTALQTTLTGQLAAFGITQ